MDDTLRLATSRIDYRAKEGEFKLDITIKSADAFGKTFAPTWDMLNRLKSGALSWGEYAQAYTALMRQRYLHDVTPFHQLIDEPRNFDVTLVLVCYCADTSHTTRQCHRYLLVDILTKIAEARGVKAVNVGELFNVKA